MTEADESRKSHGKIGDCEQSTYRTNLNKAQKSYLKDATYFINFIENTKVTENITLVSMDVTSLYTNIPQEEGICKACEGFYGNDPPKMRNAKTTPKVEFFPIQKKNYLHRHTEPQ